MLSTLLGSYQVVTMIFSSPLLVVAASLVGNVAAHGYVPFIKINGQTIAGWDVNKGEQPTFYILHCKN